MKTRKRNLVVVMRRNTYTYEEGRKAHLLGFFSAKAKVAWPTSPASKGDPVASSHTNPKDSSRSIDQVEIALVDPSMVYL